MTNTEIIIADLISLTKRLLWSVTGASFGATGSVIGLLLAGRVISHFKLEPLEAISVEAFLFYLIPLTVLFWGGVGAVFGLITSFITRQKIKAIVLLSSLPVGALGTLLWHVFTRYETM